MNLAPIALFTYNRPEETSATLDAICANPESTGSVLFVFSDAPKKEEDVDKVEKVRALRHGIPAGRFKEVRIIEQTSNLGLAKAIISGVNTVLAEFDRIIVLEDDCEVSPYFLNFMNKALEKYENSGSIGSISGFSPALKKAPDDDVYAVMRSCSMSWASWKYVWERVDFDVKDYRKMRNDIRFIRAMNRAGNDRMYRFIRQKKYDLQSWSIRFAADLTKRGLLTVYPKYSYVMNNGLESGGVHSSCSAPDALKTENDMAVRDPVLPDTLKENRKIEREFYSIYGGSMKSRIKRSIYVYLGERIIDRVKRK